MPHIVLRLISKKKTSTTSFYNLHLLLRLVSLLLLFITSFTTYCDCVIAFSSIITGTTTNINPTLSPTNQYKTTSSSNRVSLLLASSSSIVQGDMTTSTSTSSTPSSTPQSSTTLLQNDNLIDTLTITANSFSAAHGIQVETKTLPVTTTSTSSTSSNDIPIKTYQMAPMSLLPQAYPKLAFINAIQLAPYFNQLIQYVTNDYQFLINTLGTSVSEQDPYTAKLLQLYIKIYHPNINGSNSSTSNSDSIIAHSADQLGIIRSDYMLHRSNEDSNISEYMIKQVELNTIASSFAGLAHQVAKLHNYLIERYSSSNDSDSSNEQPSNNMIHQFLVENQKGMTNNDESSSTSTTTINDNTPSSVTTGIDINKPGVPHNPTLERIPYVMNLAVQRYKERFCTTTTGSTTTTTTHTNNKCGILFVVQSNETNTVDQRMLEFQLWDLYHIPVIRLSLGQIYHMVHRNTTTGALTIQTDNSNSNETIEIAVVYYRAGYAPTDYPNGYDGIEWLAREMLEISRATKCPSLGYHLAGTKKVQQELSRPGRLEQYFNTNNNNNTESSMIVQQLRNAFAGLYSLGDDVNDSDMNAVHDILINQNHHKYVLKPQREGGGYNFYGEQMLHKLQENVTIINNKNDNNNNSNSIQLSKSLGEYILMERLFPPQQNAILLRGGKVEGVGLTISELGCFGTILVAGKDINHNNNDDNNNADNTNKIDIIHNEYAGFLLRTKFSNVDEGGVASGFATLSSPYLF